MICLKCAIAIDDSTAKTYIRCDGCNRPIHTSCSDLTTNELKCLDLRPNSRRRIKYICVECEQGISQDTGLIQSLTSDLGLGDQQIKPIRLGKFDRSRQPLSRPIRVHLSSPEIVHNIV
ncbi:hypothetical protein Zmor_006349 [Zophobas morio]|uniref:PHD-type domain-containing protein n=1 Tax=Zophobas morio TaxID=2755281 RepID=A0AA38IZP0_9CUCU|nr:hypothetical protein Zmor_006349 [Zophobas morio]